MFVCSVFSPHLVCLLFLYVFLLLLLCLFFFFFFFSSRRRHTRSLCDWSSDVCSSDLAPRGAGADGGGDRGTRRVHAASAGGLHPPHDIREREGCRRPSCGARPPRRTRHEATGAGPPRQRRWQRRRGGQGGGRVPTEGRDRVHRANPQEGRG